MIRRISFIVFVLALIGPVMADAEVRDLSCVQTGPTEYKLSYTLTGGAHKVQISASADATGATGMQPVLTTEKAEVKVHAGTPGQRMYFFLKPDVGLQREVSIRHLELEGTPNFRDEGGYETTDGRFTRWGLLYRSSVLSGLTPTDLTYLSQLGVRVVCDFRTEHENEVAPDKWVSDATVKHVSAPIGTLPPSKPGEAARVPTLRDMLAGNPTPEQLQEGMKKTYRGMALDAAPQLGTVFRELVDGPLPMLYHCTGGKDRTGIFSALVLLSIGVPEKTVFEDYRLTETYSTPAGQKKMITASGMQELGGMSPEQAKVVMAADPEVLRSALTAINDQYGSLANYRRQALHISDNDIEKLQAVLLTQ